MKSLKWVVLTGALILFSSVLVQAQCTVGWDAYTDSATEFRLYINSTTTYITIKPITLTSYAVVASYLTQVKNTMYLTAYDAVNSRESVPSNTVTWTKPLTAPQILRITIP